MTITRSAFWIGLALAVMLVAIERVAACPFCSAVKPTLAQQRDAATLVVIGQTDGNQLSLLKVLKGEGLLHGAKQVSLAATSEKPPAGLLLGMTNGDPTKPAELEWSLQSVNESELAYFVRAPVSSQPASKRLKYYAPFLEHADRLIAEDAFLEFGHAPWDAVRSAADVLSMDRLRAWLVDPAVRPEHKGFYGLALGLAKEPADRKANGKLLRAQIARPASDFRAGFDGMLAGLLVLDGADAVRTVKARCFDDPATPHGDVLHGMAAVRFYHDYATPAVKGQLDQAFDRLLARPEFAAAALVDLSRWKHWDSTDKAVRLFSAATNADPVINRAVVAYLRASPQPSAHAELDRLRRQSPEPVGEAERYLELTGSAR